MANYLVTDTELISIADAIRVKGGTSDQLIFPSGFISAVNDISGGTYESFDKGKVVAISSSSGTIGLVSISTWEGGSY